MNPRRLITAALAAFGTLFVTDFLIHNIWLSPIYNKENLWSPNIGPLSKMILVNIGELLIAATFTLLWAQRVLTGGNLRLRQACGYGLLMGLFYQSQTLIFYGSYPLPVHLAMRWFVAGVAQTVVMGAIVFWIYRPKTATAPTPQQHRFKWVIRTAILAFVILVGWQAWTGGRQKIHPTAPWMSQFASKWFVETPGKAHSVQTVSDLKKNDEDSLRFELKGGDVFRDALFRGSYRVEADTQDFPPMNSVRWYALSIYLPKDFPIENNRLLLAQWHGSDKKSLGEVSRSPSLAFRFTDGIFSIPMRHSAERIVKDADAVPNEKLFKTREFPLGQWNDFVVQAKWSYQSDGFVNVWWNGKQIVEYRGPVGYNDDVGPYFRFGLYRDATDKTYVAYFNQVKLGERPEDVGFDPATAMR